MEMSTKMPGLHGQRRQMRLSGLGHAQVVVEQPVAGTLSVICIGVLIG